MLRRKISTGLLRGSKSSSSLRSTALQHAQPPAVPSPQVNQTAGIASAALLGSQRNWAKETVLTLKQELKNRGLSQTGAKSLLVDRLKSSEATAFLPPMPVTPSRPMASANFARHLSTTAKVSAKKPQQPRQLSDPITDVPETPISAETVLSTGPQVVSQRTEAPKTEEITPELESSAPGLPETRVAAEPAKDALDVQLPEIPNPEHEVAQSIPLVPDNFQGKPTTQPEPEPEVHTPKVVTVASASTHIGGGPTHAIHESTDAHTLEEDPKEPEIDVGALASTLTSALGAPARAFKSTGVASSLPSIGAAKGFGPASKEYKASDKKLNDEEKRGAWIFGGIVGLGLLLGGGRKKKDHSHDDEKSGKSGKSGSGKGGAGLQGDAEWSKASGAGIVGHGARKD